MSAWRKIKVWISGLAGVAAACATAYLGFEHDGVLPKSRAGDVLAVVLLAVVAVGSSALRPVRIFVFGRAQSQRAKVGAALRALPWALYELSDGAIPVRPLGVSAWVVRGVPWIPKGRWLSRIARERVNDLPVRTGIRWTKGKGVIGECWLQGRPVTVDSRDRHELLADVTKEEWESLPRAEHSGMSYRDFKRITGKYGMVVAVPIVNDRGSTVGVVSLDAPFAEECNELLDSKAVEEEVSKASTVVAGLIGAVDPDA